MSAVKFWFIGCGNMGSALAKAVCRSQGGGNVLLSDISINKAELLSQELGSLCADTASVATNAKYIFLGVKPQVMPELTKELTPIFENRKDRFVLITMAAGVKISSICNYFGKSYPIIRIMPNTPVSVAKGMILYTTSKEVLDEEINDFCMAIEFAGKLDKIDEEFIDAASALSGCGPAFVYMFAESLANAGEKCGLTREKALLYASQTLSGAAELLLTSNKNPSVLREEVCSPGGSTIEGVRKLENNGFNSAVIEAVEASFKRTKELGK